MKHVTELDGYKDLKQALEQAKPIGDGMVQFMTVQERLAIELHRQYRAAEKAMNRAKLVWRKGKQIPNPNLLLHDHGWTACGKQKYFRKRAALVIARAECKHPETLGEAEQALDSAVLMRRLKVQGK
jgi:hypothetical protein